MGNAYRGFTAQANQIINITCDNTNVMDDMSPELRDHLAPFPQKEGEMSNLEEEELTLEAARAVAGAAGSKATATAVNAYRGLTGKANSILNTTRENTIDDMSPELRDHLAPPPLPLLVTLKEKEEDKCPDTEEESVPF